jgi:Skp family chaperone for outer membrane proteins
MTFLQLNVLIFFIIFFALINQEPCFGQSKIRIGIYDSRAVMLAYFNSGYNKTFMQTLNEFNKKKQKATQENDSVAIKKLNFEGPIRQAMLHEKVFGTGSVRNEIMEIKAKIDSLAKAGKIDLVVSKWELNYSNPNCEIIDLTDQITSLFQPDQRFGNMLKELLKTEPTKDAYLIQD